MAAARTGEGPAVPVVSAAVAMVVPAFAGFVAMGRSGRGGMVLTVGAAATGLVAAVATQAALRGDPADAVWPIPMWVVCALLAGLGWLAGSNDRDTGGRR